MLKDIRLKTSVRNEVVLHTMAARSLYSLQFHCSLQESANDGERTETEVLKVTVKRYMVTSNVFTIQISKLVSELLSVSSI